MGRLDEGSWASALNLHAADYDARMTHAIPVPPLPAMRPGLYRHYKGELYEVSGVARHSETLEVVVVYRPLYGEGALWIRPFDMFNGTVPVDGQDVPRFAWAGTP